MTEKTTKKSKEKSQKELTEEMESLSDKNNLLEEKVKKLEEVIKDVIKKIQHLEGSNSISEKGFKCCYCEKSFETKSGLKNHNAEHKRVLIDCSECGETFEKHWMLELHLKSHVNVASYDCEVCRKKFQVKWKLRKHMDIHNIQTKKCQYFNNEKRCPYEEIGCKFLHEISEMCFHKDNCKNKLCPYKHKETDDEDIVEKEIHLPDIIGDNNTEETGKNKPGQKESNDNILFEEESAIPDSEVEKELECNWCKFEAKTTGGLKKHINAKHLKGKVRITQLSYANDKSTIKWDHYEGEVICEDGCAYELWAKFSCKDCGKMTCPLCTLDPTDGDNMENTDKYT